MTPTFAETAYRLAGLATRTFCWSPDQFWRATPAEVVTAFATQGYAAPASMSRTELAALIERDNHD